MSMTVPVWGTQRPAVASKACHVFHQEAGDCLRRPASGPSVLVPAPRSSFRVHRAPVQSSTATAAATAEAPAGAQRAASTGKMLVDLAIEHLPVSFGAGVRAVGSCVELGSWSVDDAPDLDWSEGHNWHKRLELPAGEQHDFKFVIIQDDREWWEQGDNRKAEVPKEEPEVQQRLELRCQYNNQGAMQAKAEAEKPAPAAAPAAAPSKAPEGGKLAGGAGQPKPKGRTAQPNQAAATEASTKDPDFKEIQKQKEDDGSLTFTFPKGYRFRGGIEDAPPEDDAESTQSKELDEYETGEVAQVTEDPETAKNRQQLEANWKPVFSDSDAAKMDEAYGKTAGSSSESFDMDKLGEGAEKAGGWTMSDEYDAPEEEYGEDRADADKDDGPGIDWTKDGAGQTRDYTDPGDFDFEEE